MQLIHCYDSFVLNNELFREVVLRSVYQIIRAEDKSEWSSIIENFSNKDVYYFQAYCSLYKDSENGEPLLFLYKDKAGNTMCYPFLKRNIKTLPFIKDFPFDKDYYDIVNPYGYGGPLYDVSDEDTIRAFREAFDEYCRNENIISEFVRFHPMLDNHKYLHDLMDIKKISQTIYIDLNKNEEEMFMNYHNNHRRNIKKAVKNELEYRILRGADAFSYIDDFLDLYNETMDKLNASSYYYFSKEYFENILNGLSEQSFIGAVFFEGQMITAALCMYCGKNLHYHLGCSKKEFLHLGVNAFQFHNIALWGKENGYRVFHLGGGYAGSESLFNFKKRFNPEGTLDFYIGKKIHNSVLYQKLLKDWEIYYSQVSCSNYFPAYRLEPKVVKDNDMKEQAIKA